MNLLMLDIEWYAYYQQGTILYHIAQLLTVVSIICRDAPNMNFHIHLKPDLSGSSLKSGQITSGPT